MIQLSTQNNDIKVRYLYDTWKCQFIKGNAAQADSTNWFLKQDFRAGILFYKLGAYKEVQLADAVNVKP